jgi:hypothetical protein
VRRLKGGGVGWRGPPLHLLEIGPRLRRQTPAAIDAATTAVSKAGKGAACRCHVWGKEPPRRLCQPRVPCRHCRRLPPCVDAPATAAGSGLQVRPRRAHQAQARHLRPAGGGGGANGVGGDVAEEDDILPVAAAAIVDLAHPALNPSRLLARPLRAADGSITKET